MSEAVQSDAALKQLEFELDQGSGPRFLLAVCNSASRANNLRAAVETHLMEIGISSITIMAPKSRGSLVDAILDQTGSTKLGAVHIVQSENIDAGNTEKLFAELNFQRDSLAKLNAPIIVWLHSNQIQQLVTKAPDFWSRRTAIVYFDDISIGTLLNRIFGRAETTIEAAPDEISKALKQVLASERDIQSCLSDKHEFSLHRMDNIIQKLRSGVQRLLGECKKGRRIHVTLWLWNSSQMNSRLRSRIPYIRDAYLDRSELLLPMAERIEEVLQRYLDGLDERIRHKLPINLVGWFFTYAGGIWRNMVRHASRDAMSFLIEPFDSVSEQSLGQVWPENIIRNRMTEQFESWLAGDSEKKPFVFSDEEAAVLKYLYHRRQGRLSPPVSSHRMKELMPELQAKVRLWLDDLGDVNLA